MNGTQNAKEDTGKSIKNALCVLWYAKRHLLSRSDVQTVKNQALNLGHCLVSRSVSQSVDNSIEYVNKCLEFLATC